MGNHYGREISVIDFYRAQIKYYKKIGIGNKTLFQTTVTKELIECTKNRLNQLVTGRKTEQNMCDIEKGIYKVTVGKLNELNQLHNSNRSFRGDITSKFQIRDLEPMQQHRVYDYFDYYDNEYSNREPLYIDKITTAYNSEIMREILSHNN